MPEIITCPMCSGKLRLPERLLGKKVRCPECKKIFVAGPEARQAPPPPPRQRDGIVPPPIRKPASPPVGEMLEIVEEDILEEEAPRPAARKPARREEDDYDEAPRPSKRRRRDEEDDEDEAPRSRRRRSDDDYDDEPSRKRKRRRRKDDDYDEEDDEELDEQSLRSRYRAWSRQCRWVRLGLFLNFIGGCVCAGAGGLLLLIFLLVAAGVKMSFDTIDTFMMLAGLPAFLGWITGAVGLGFLVVAPNRNGARGLAIAAAAVGGVHLIFLIVVAFGEAGTNSMGGLSIKKGVNWIDLVSSLPYLDTMTLTKMVEAVPMLAGLLEVARAIVLFLCVRALAIFAKEWGLARGAMGVIIGFPSTVGALLLVNLILRLSTSSIKSEGAARFIAILVLLLNGLPLVGLYAWCAALFNSGRNNVEPPRSNSY